MKPFVYCILSNHVGFSIPFPQNIVILTSIDANIIRCFDALTLSNCTGPIVLALKVNEIIAKILCFYLFTLLTDHTFSVNLI